MLWEKSLGNIIQIVIKSRSRSRCIFSVSGMGRSIIGYLHSRLLDGVFSYENNRSGYEFISGCEDSCLFWSYQDGSYSRGRIISHSRWDYSYRRTSSNIWNDTRVSDLIFNIRICQYLKWLLWSRGRSDQSLNPSAPFRSDIHQRTVDIILSVYDIRIYYPTLPLWLQIINEPIHYLDRFFSRISSG